MTVIGIDGWKGRWVGIVLQDGQYSGSEVFDELTELKSRHEFQAVGIDVPIGLAQLPGREADGMARKKIGKRGSSVFNSPPHFCLDESWTEYRKANAECRRRCHGQGISAHGFALMKNIRQAERARKLDSRIHEVHPEVSFCEMNGGSALGFNKKTWNGRAERVSLLKNQEIELPELLPDAFGMVPTDDVLDAAAAAWTAHRIALGEADALPDRTRQYERIWY